VKPEPRAVVQDSPEPVRQPAAVEKTTPAAVESAPPEPDLEPGAVATVSIGDVRREWQKVLRHVQKVLKQPQASACAREGQPLDIVGNALRVAFGPRWEFHRNVVESNSRWFEQGILDIMGARLKVTTVASEDPGAVAEPAEKSPEAESVQHPLMNDVLTMFDGTLIEDGGNNPWEE
jgi:hypothetical protein